MRRNGPSQKGVHALFTAPKEKRKGRTEALGLVTALLGTAVWIWALAVFLGDTQPILMVDRTSSSIMLLSLAVPLIAVGSTTFAYSRVTRHTEDVDPSSLAREVEALTTPRSAGQQSYLPAKQDVGRTGAELLAIAEGVMIVMLYGGLLREYDSSIYMREWVQNNLPIATFALNDNIFFLVIGAIIATIAIHLLSRKAS